MNLVIKQSTSSTEVISSSKIVETLYQLTKPDPTSGLPAANAILRGRIQVPSAYQDTINFLNTLFSEENSDNGSDFLVSVLNNNYNIRLADPTVEEIIKFAMGKDEDEGISITEAALFNIGNVLVNNVDIISFDEFPYFTNANLIQPANFSGCTSLERIDLSNCTKFGNFRYCSSLEYFNGPNSESGVLTIAEGTTSIGDYNFSNCKKLTEVYLPDSLTSIKYRCFEGSDALQTIHFGTGISNIDEYVFNVANNSVKNIYIKDLNGWLNCNFGGGISNAHHLYLDSNGTSTEITSIDFTGRTTIGKNSLRGDSYITNVTIPDTIISVGSDAFRDCSGLLAVYISDLSAWCNIIFDNQYSNPLYYAHHLYLNGLEITSITIPSDITWIKAYTFAGGQGITSITIPNNITSIGDGAFRDTYITSITVPDSVTEIKKDTFNNCTNLLSVTISSNTTVIGNSAFNNCTNLESINSNVSGVVNIPNSVTHIGSGCFQNCKHIKTVVLPDNLTSIEDSTFSGSNIESVTLKKKIETIKTSAFYYCEHLTSIAIPESVTKIESNAFILCRGLQSVHITNLEAWCNIKFADSNANPLGNGHHLFLNGTEITDLVIPNTITTILSCAFHSCRGLTSVTIPSSVTSIGYQAFSGCRGLTSVTIPASVTTIGEAAFYGCSNLTSVTIPASVTTIGKQAFYGCSTLTSVTVKRATPVSIDSTVFSNQINATLYVPHGCATAYQAANYWKEFNLIIELPEE